ncbi:septal ring lytic transglycosylase RlpA family protein [Nisaea acidiphila]|uniref:Endolytic peptidoglycan transglycosylase RlpA n=1 Tax=Nisaea acidiphila TaxID=1862145 RepID=A0A9J7AXL8_9PROT|nr:septal ring lytic transglycosylase RlpA family protein [Nisaea acidiphila]UUX50165.1 septal ring lytic transglycosylase RlpA family protein [Nisaea acidiphila]
MKSLATLSVVTLAILLSACAETEFVVHTAKQLNNATSDGQPLGRYKVGSPYQINGVWYYPQVDYGYVETGIASWYGPNFHNKATANGEVFDQNDVTAAHRTLPMPSVVRVTNLENGRALVVRVNDRGPFAHGRIIDLSRRSAQLLGFERQGTAKVRVEILPEESRLMAESYSKGRPVRLASLNADSVPVPAPSAAPSVSVSKSSVATIPGSVTLTPPPAPTPAPVTSSAASPAAQGSAVDLARQSRDTATVIQTEPEKTEIFVQAGAFTNATNADKLTTVLASVGPVAISPKLVNGKYFYRVRLGPLETVEDADKILEAVIDRGYPGARVIVE